MKKIFLILFTVFSLFMIRAEETDALRKAATGGDAYSQFRLGNEYFYGTEARKENRELAVYWFKKAADQGLPEAQLNYAICLERGLGIKADPVNAAPYYRKAADQGNNTAALNLALLYLYGSGKQMEAEPAKAVPILQKLSEQKIAAAMIELSAFQLNQQEVTTETRNKAFQMLLEAREQFNEMYDEYGGFNSSFNRNAPVRDEGETVYAFLQKGAESLVKQNADIVRSIAEEG